EWFRYHHLLRELLRTDLERRHPARVRQLLERACDWCEAQGLDEEALEYALQLEDSERMVQLLTRHALDMHREGRDAQLARWFDWFEENELLIRYPSLAALGAWLQISFGRPGAVRRWAEAA